MDDIESGKVWSWHSTGNADDGYRDTSEDEDIPQIRVDFDSTGEISTRYLLRRATLTTIYSTVSLGPLYSRYSHFKDNGCPPRRLTTSANRTENHLYQLNTKLLEAVEKGEIEEISRLLDQGANPNATCQLSNVSACHLAALKDNDALSLLIRSKAESFRADNFGRIPLHFAAWAGNAKQVALLLNIPEDTTFNFGGGKVSSVDYHLINTPCTVESQPLLKKIWRDSMEHYCMRTNANLPLFKPGWTALHSASARAQYSCIQLLLAAGADPCAQDHTARTPLDVVGNAHYLGFKIDVHNFRETIKILLIVGGKITYTYTTDLSNENTPLHTAVQLESEEAIKELLNAGASATCLNSDGLTPMHICVEKQLKEHLQILANFEYSNQDPNGAILDAKDVNGLTVLHAAVRDKWNHGVRIALGAGANISIKDNEGETPIHTAAAMGEIDILEGILTVATCCIDLLNQAEKTALFVAVIHNNLEVVKLLIKYGASTRVDEPHRINILHVAAQHGHIEMLQFLLDYDGRDIECLINDISQRDRYSPIIYAVVNNHPECVKFLLRKGAQLDLNVPFEDDILKESIWSTALHIAATKNHYEIAKIILDFDRESINRPNSAKLLPIHQACMHGNREIITLFIHKGADLSFEHSKLKTPMGMLMDHLPKPTGYMEEILDAYITSQGTLQDRKYQVTVSYEILLPNGSNGKNMEIIKALINTGNRYGQRKLLQHPLIESFLYLEWRALLPFFYVLLALYGLFSLSLNIYIVSVFFYEDKNKLNITNETDFVDNMYPSKPVPNYLRSDVWKYMIYVTASIIAMQEIMFIRNRTKRDILCLETWVKFGAIGLSMFLPSVVSWRDAETVRDSPYSPEWVRLVATIAVLLTWLKLMFLLCRFPIWGFYALMFGKVTTKVFKVLLTFGVLIVGSSLCFMIQFRAQPPFEGLWATLTKTFVMMTSEFDYTSMINKQSALEIDASILILRVIFIIFVFFASIVLMNLMVGVAVNDVNYLEIIGSQKRLEKQVDFLTSLEGVTCHKLIRNILTKQKTTNQWNALSISLRPRDPKCTYCKILPRHIKDAIYEKAQLKQINTELSPTAYKNKLDELMRAILRQDEKLEKIQKHFDIIEYITKDIEKIRDDLTLTRQLMQNLLQLRN